MTADVPTTGAISDEMIEAAARAMCAFDEPDETASHWDQWHVAYTISARTALTAALPDLAQPSDEAVAQGDVLQTILWLASNRAKQVVWEQDRLVWEKVISLIHDELHRLAQSSGRGADHAREAENPILGMALDYYAERRTMNNPKGWDHVLRVVNDQIEKGQIRASMVQVDHARRVLSALARDEVTGR